MKKRLIPELRFSDFSEEWEEKKLGNLLEFKNGINASKEQYGKGIKFINVLDILQDNFITYDNIIGKVDVDDKTFKNYEVNYGDVLFQRSSETREEVGKANVYIDTKPATFGGFVIRGKKISEYNPILLNFALDCPYTRREIMIRSGGSTRYNVSQQILSEAPVVLPKMKEQIKIADFLNLVNGKIKKQEEKIINLEEYKKGMMQKVFSQEIRFKDKNGEEYPKWRWRDLGNILVEQNIKCKDNDYDVISSTIKGLYYQKDYFNKDIASNDKSSYKILKKNQIVFSPQNLWMGNINFNDSIEIGIVSPSYKIYNIRKEYCPEFIGYIIKTPYILHQYLQSSEQGASVVRRNLNLDLFNLIKVKVPLLQEQTKIANFLTLIDSKIEKEIDKLESIKELKKGLMQKMFI